MAIFGLIFSFVLSKMYFRLFPSIDLIALANKKGRM